MCGLTVYVKEGLPFPQDLSLENSADFYLCFWLALLHSKSYFFFFYQSRSSSLCTVFDSVSSNIDGLLLINPSAKVFVFGDVHHKEWLTYSGGTYRPGDPRLWFLQSCSFGFISFFWCKYSFYNGFSSIGKFWSYCCLSFHWLSIIFTMQCPISSHCLWLFLCWLGWSLRSFERCSLGGYL